MTYSDQAGVPVLAIIQFYKKPFLAGHFLVGLQLLPQQGMTYSVHSCSKGTTVSSKMQLASGKWNPWSNPPCQPGITPVNISTHTQPINKMEDLLLHYLLRRIPSNLDFLASAERRLSVQQPRSTTSNWRARGESAKTSNGAQQHN